MYRNSKHTILFPLILAAGVLAGLFLGLFLGRSRAESNLRGLLQQVASPNDKLSYTLSLIERHYIDSIGRDSLVEQAIPLLISELDPHSTYIPLRDMQAVNEPLEGEFDGIGVVFNMATDTVVVLNVIRSGPSDKAGVRAGDRILRINDTLVAGQKIPQDQIVKRLRGKRGTTVRLALQRQQIEELIEVEVKRDVIPMKSVDAAFMITPKIGFLKLSQFARTSHRELKEALALFAKRGAEGLIFDLRGNSGGYLDQAILIANEFLEAGRLIVYTEDRLGKQLKEYSDGRGGATSLALAILIDEESASSSEILAGAIQDNDRGVIVGRRSFGKGLVQRQIPYPDGSALRLTTARYYTPTGRCIQKPYTRGDAQGYEMEILQRYRDGEIFSQDSIHLVDSLRYTTPAGRTVYGGGGIMPDHFVAADTTDITPWFVQVSGRNILYRYTMEYADRHREALNRVETLEELQQLLDADRELLGDFLRYAQRQGVKPIPHEIARSRRIVEAQLRAYIGRNTVLEDNGFYRNIYPIDRVVLTAIEEVEEELKERKLN
uniref:S41 family peptidase n=1 Tax=Alistipes sp. TaxID=1872444 RepID=UPI0040570BD1